MFYCNLYRTLQLFTDGDFDIASFKRVIAGYFSTFLVFVDYLENYFSKKIPIGRILGSLIRDSLVHILCL